MTSPDTEAPENENEVEEQKPKLTLDVKIDAPSACERHITVTVPRADIDRYFKDATDELMPKAEVAGFRPGRAPRKLVETRFREQLSEQVKGSVLMDSMTQVSEDSEFSAISEPDFDYDAVELPEDGPMTFEFDVEVRPEFEMPEWKGLTLERPSRELTDEDVDRRLKELLRSYAHMAPQDGPVERDDFVTLNIVARRDGEETARLDEESVQVLPTLSFRDAELTGFDELVVGCAANDKKQATVKAKTQPEDGAEEEVDIDVELEVLDIKRVEYPEMDESFLDRIGGFANEGELREVVRNSLDRQMRYHEDRAVRQQITGVLTESASWELPPDLLKRQSRRELERAVLELRSSGFGEETIRAHENELRRNSMSTTETALKEHFILERIAEDEELDATPEDLDMEVAMIASQSNQSPRRVRARMEKRGQMDALRNQVIERKAIDLITSHAEFKDVPFELPTNDSFALDFAIASREADTEIPEAKHGGDAGELPEHVDHS